MMTSLKRCQADNAILCAPNPSAGHCQPMPLLEIPGHSWASLGQSLVGSLLLPLGPGAHKVLSVPSQSLFLSPVYALEALWWVKGDLLQEGFCHAQLDCTQSPCPCGRPLLTLTPKTPKHIQWTITQY